MSDSLRDRYEVLLELPAAERDAWMQKNCVDSVQRDLLRQMLAVAATQEQGGWGVSAPERLQRLQAGAVFNIEGEHWIGHRIGPFRLLRLVGQGGMGAVFLAQRESADFDQRVAVKLLRRGLLSQLEHRLFRRERRALAALSHPNIARLVDGGVSETGVPYLAMEFVEGEPITDHCRHLGLDVRARLELVLSVCRAVDAAHRALIVHRDIKPSNILVTVEGTVKLLDFGIAKLLDGDEPETGTGLAVLTPEYAAPEQFCGAPITTATDVYSLGILLHELLLGERPHEHPARRPSSRALELAHSNDPERASPLTLRAALRGDLDNIILKSLELEPARRYASAGVLGDDIERHLNGQPVEAHPPSRWYRARKFVQRHRGGVVVAAAMMLAVLASLGIAIWQARVARDQAARANAVRDLLVEILRETAPNRVAAEMPKVPDLVYEASKRLLLDLGSQPEVRAELQTTLGNVLRHMNDIPHSEALLLEAEQAIADLPAYHRLRVEHQVEMTRLLLRKGDMDGASVRLDRLLEIPASRLPESVPQAMLQKLAMVSAINRAEVAKAVAIGAAMIDIYRDDCARGLRCAEAAMAQHDYASVLLGAGDLPAARALLVDAWEKKQRLGVPVGSVIETSMVLAAADLYRGDLQQSQHWLEQAEQLNKAQELQRPRLSPLLHRVEMAMAREEAAPGLALIEKLRDGQNKQGISNCSLATTELYRARLLLLVRPDDALAASRNSQELAADCHPGNRLLNAELATLVAGRAQVALGDPESAHESLATVMLSFQRSQGSAPNRRMLFLGDAMRLCAALGMAAQARQHAASLVDYLDHIGAEASAPWRLEARAILLGVDDAAGHEALARALAPLSDWPLAQRLQRSIDARMESTTSH